jgi:hypothetical protein
MRARLATPADIPAYQKWRGIWGWSPADPDSLPKNGIIIEEDGEPLLIGYIYRTDSNVAFLTGIAANPEASELRRGKALRLFSEAAVGGARALGAKELIGWTNNTAVLKANISQGAELVAANVGLWRKEI